MGSLFSLGVQQACRQACWESTESRDDGVIDAGDVLGVQPERAPFWDQGDQQTARAGGHGWGRDYLFGAGDPMLRVLRLASRASSS